jgi:hypothetical protein
MADIFISYASVDRPTARRLADALEACGWSVWWDHRSLRGGQHFDRIIEEAISTARVVIVIWSQNSIKSDWVRAEAAQALDENKLVPLRIDRAVPPLRFRNIHTVDLLSWTGETEAEPFEKLIETLNYYLGPSNSSNRSEQPGTRTEPSSQAEPTDGARRFSVGDNQQPITGRPRAENPWWIRSLPILTNKWLFMPAVAFSISIYFFASYCGTSGTWSASDLQGGVDFGGTLGNKHFADYHVDLSSTKIQINIKDCERVVGGSLNMLATELLRDPSLVLRNPGFGPIPPNVHSFEFSGFSSDPEGFTVDFRGSNVNKPKSSAQFKGKFINTCPLPWFFAKVFKECIQLEGELFTFRTDVEAPLDWKVVMPVTMSR